MPRLRQPPEKPEKVEAPEQEQIVNEKSPEQEVEVVAQQESDDSLALKKQLEDLKKSEELQKQQLKDQQAAAERYQRERDDAKRQAQLREQEIAKFKEEADKSQFDAVSNALAAAKAEAEKAQTDIETALNNGDYKAQSEAYRRLARAEASILTLETGKQEIEERRKDPPKEPLRQETRTADPIEDAPIPENAKAYLRQHRELITNEQLNRKVRALHEYIVNVEGQAAFSQPYFDSMDVHLGYVEDEKVDEPDPPPVKETRQKGPPVSAPVSREVPTSNGRQDKGKIKLTAEQVEAAKVAGVSLEEYAKQLLKLQEMRANGSYGDRQ